MGQEDKRTIWNLIARKLSAEASAEDLRELERLLKANPDLHYPVQTISDMWKSSADPDMEAAETSFSRHLDRIKELNTDFPDLETPSHSEASDLCDNPWPGKKTHSRRRLHFLTITGCVALLTIAIGVFKKSPHADPAPVANLTAATVNEIYTANGSRMHLTLPDGTLVWLNAGSRLSYGKNYNAGTREVNLNGEAFFDVAHNSQKPFRIHTAKIDVEVLGTSFNVKSYLTDRTTEATLIRGSIEVSVRDRPSEKIILKPNEKLVIANDDSSLHRFNPRRYAAGSTNEPLVTIRQPTYEQKTGAIIETSWVDNKLTFREEKFGDVARQMERWYGVTIRFGDSTLQDAQLTGSFKEETIQQALEALKYTTRFTYIIEANQITINK